MNMMQYEAITGANEISFSSEIENSYLNIPIGIIRCASSIWWVYPLISLALLTLVLVSITYRTLVATRQIPHDSLEMYKWCPVYHL